MFVFEQIVIDYDMKWNDQDFFLTHHDFLVFLQQHVKELSGTVGVAQSICENTIVALLNTMSSNNFLILSMEHNNLKSDKTQENIRFSTSVHTQIKVYRK